MGWNCYGWFGTGESEWELMRVDGSDCEWLGISESAWEWVRVAWIGWELGSG